MTYIFENTVLGFCWWEIPALLVLLAVIVMFIVKRQNMRDEEKELEDRLSEIYADDTVDADSEV